MFDELKEYCNTLISFNEKELNLIEKYFEINTLKKKNFLLQDGKVCNFISFIAKGVVRHFHIKEGIEKTCYISFENSWVTDFKSFTHGTPCIINLQVMEDTILYTIRKENLYQLYRECNKYETIGRLMAEQVAQRATDIAMSLSSEKPEERFQNLLQKQSDLFQRIPQKYIANFLGISPESLSRIQKRVHNKQKS